MNSGKKYWCFTCNAECQIEITNTDGDEEYQCTKCKNTFIEEITQDNNPSEFHIDSQQQQQQQQNQPNISNNTFNNLESLNITISNINPLNNINLSNFNNFNNFGENISNQNQSEPNYEYGMNNTLLFLPSTVNYRRQETEERNRIMNDFLSGGEIITEVVNPNGQNIIISRNFINSNSPINNFLINHINDPQFENFINIITAFDIQHKGNPPASERAIKNLKKIEINENNIHDFDGLACNVCLENFSEGQISNQIDCGHYFHEKCIVHWLKMRNTCPVCRHELESNDPNYEKRKHSNREMVRNLHTNSGNNNNNNNNNNQASPPA